MKALFYTNPNEMTYRETADPNLPNAELLVRIEAAGICGSDMHAYHGHDARRVPPHDEVDAFCTAVDDLANDVDRLEARMARLDTRRSAR